MIQDMDQSNPRFVLIYGGERSGKSFSTVAMLGKKLAPNKYPEERMYWIVGPDYMQSRAEFQVLYNIYNSLGLVTKSSMPDAPTSRWSMTLSTNERWETRSSKDIKKLASFSIWGALIVEANQQEPAVWLKIRGRLMEKRGWCLISGTYENVSEWFVDLYDKWSVHNAQGGKSYSLPTWANAEAFPLGEDDPEIVQARTEMPAEFFMERYGGKPSKPTNLVIPEFDYERHVAKQPLQVIPDIPVELAIDPGKRVYCVAFIQKVGRDRVHVLDCIYKRNWIAQSIIPEVMKHELWPYVLLGGAPHGAIDVAGFAEPGTISQVEIWRTMAKVHLVGQKYPEDVEIQTLRHILAMNMVTFNNLGNESVNGKAMEPLAEFRLWRWAEMPGAVDEADKPKDANNHFTKALMYWWLWRIGPVAIGSEKKFRKRGAHRWSNGSRSRNQGNNTRVRSGETPVQQKRAAMGRRLRSQILVGGARGGSKSFRSTRASYD